MLPKGSYGNGETVRQFVWHTDLVWKAGTRELVSSKSVLSGSANVQVYIGPDRLLQCNLHGSSLFKSGV